MLKKKPIVKEELPIKRSAKTPKMLRGFRDILPGEQSYWNFVRDTARRIIRDYGFQQMDTPILEDTSLFVKGTGKTTDIVEKEMFSFIDKGEENVSLRPEFTPGFVRAYIDHGMLNLPQPVKLFTVGPVFRHEKPQSGRYRQFEQVNLEIFGDGLPVVDAFLIYLCQLILSELGLKFQIQINSIGSPESRAEFKKHLLSYYRPKKAQLCEDCINRMAKNPLRMLDCKVEGCVKLKADAPQIIDYLNEEDKTHFMKVLGMLDELEIPYNLNPLLVRGLDYYTRTVFEIWGDDDEGGKSTLCAGGRYDLLVEMLGGRPTPAIGCAFGTDRLVLKLKDTLGKENRKVPTPPILVFVAQLGDSARVRAMRLFEEMRKKGVKVAELFIKDNLKGQLEYANKLGVKYAFVLGQKEVIEGTVLIRDMESGVQESVPYEKALDELKWKLEKNYNISI